MPQTPTIAAYRDSRGNLVIRKGEGVLIITHRRAEEVLLHSIFENTSKRESLDRLIEHIKRVVPSEEKIDEMIRIPHILAVTTSVFLRKQKIRYNDGLNIIDRDYGKVITIMPTQREYWETWLNELEKICYEGFETLRISQIRDKRELIKTFWNPRAIAIQILFLETR
mgnify:CR=1 FL=1